MKRAISLFLIVFGILFAIFTIVEFSLFHSPFITSELFNDQLVSTDVIIISEMEEAAEQRVQFSIVLCSV